MVDLPLPTAADAGKVLRVTADGSGYELAADLRYDTPTDAWLIGKRLRSIWPGLPPNFVNPLQSAFEVAVNGVSAIGQADPLGAIQNIYSLGPDQNWSFGPLWDKGLNSGLCFNPVNKFWQDTVWDWTGVGVPNGLHIDALGHGYQAAPGGDNNYVFSTGATAGDGLLITATNRRMNLAYFGQIYFMLSVDNPTGINLQFGLETIDRTQGIEFAFSSTSGQALLKASIWNAAGETDVQTSWASIGGRNVFTIRIPRDGQGQVELFAGDADLVYQPLAGCAFDKHDPHMPSPGANLIPFVLFKTNANAVRNLTMGPIEFMSGF